MKPIIEVQNLSKKFQINAHKARYLSLRDSLMDSFKFKNKATKEDFWALQDLNFTVEAGESIGIIGRNGAGKSTLLKILSRITPPTKGRVILRGRVASLLEVGTGFHPELTGRENVYFNGSILGLRKFEIDRRFDEIVDFSGVEQFIDTPLKHYSSGMQLRLAFAVAAHLEPEILLIDEVLAVGDAEFQKKCLGKMDDVAKSGRTVLFVSHNMAAVETLCKKCLILQNGKTLFEGSATDSICYYLENSIATNAHFIAKNEKQYKGNDSIKIVSAKIETDNNNPIIDVTSDVYFSVTIINQTKEVEISVGYDLQNVVGDTIFGSGLKANCPIGKPTTLICHIPKNFLNDGMYSIFFYSHTKAMAGLLHEKNLLTFEVKDSVRESGYLGKINGAVRPKLNWQVQ
jgi:lipopolysaccharide transport system ATP-binding protein